jgi:hypothetical protein
MKLRTTSACLLLLGGTMLQAKAPLAMTNCYTLHQRCLDQANSRYWQAIQTAEETYEVAVRDCLEANLPACFGCIILIMNRGPFMACLAACMGMNYVCRNLANHEEAKMQTAIRHANQRYLLDETNCDLDRDQCLYEQPDHPPLPPLPY